MTRGSMPLALAAALALGADGAGAQRWDAYTLGGATARPGTRASGFLEVPAGADSAVRIPVSVLRGARPGPTVAMVAGVHGAEYPPIVALQRLLPRLDPTAMAGTVVMVHVANPNSFFRRTVYFNPADGKNLNRVFPGRADGTQTERIARAITDQVVRRADYLFDLHAGDANESLRHYTVVYLDTPSPAAEARSLEMALAFGIDYVVLHRGMARDTGATQYLSATGATRGVPTLAVESGELGRVDDESVARIERGILSVLASLGVAPGRVERTEHPVYLGEATSVRSPATGFFYPAVERGQLVKAGTPLGHITDLFGRRVADVAAPMDGVVRYHLAAPPVTEGETLVSMARILENPSLPAGAR